MRLRITTLLLSLSSALPMWGAVDVTSQIQDVGGTYLLEDRPITVVTPWRNRLWVFTGTEGGAMPMVVYDPATGVWSRDDIEYLDTEKVWDAYGDHGDLFTRAEDEAGGDNRTSGYLRTDRGWVRYRVPQSNAHFQGQARFGKRWFSGSFGGDPIGDIYAKPWIVWTDDLGATTVRAPAGNLPNTDKVIAMGNFFTLRGGFFANGDGANPDNNVFNLLHYTGVDADPFELTYAERAEWCGASIFASVGHAVEFGGYLFGTMGHNGSYSAFRWTPVARAGRYGSYLAPGDPLLLAAPDYRQYFNSPPHPNPTRQLCGSIVAKHGWLWAVYSDYGQLNRPANPPLNRLGEWPVVLTIARSSDGETWQDLLTLKPGPDVFKPLATVFPCTSLAIADNGDLYLRGKSQLYRLPASAYGGYTPNNHPPVAVADAFRVGTGTTLDVISGPEGVLANDRDVDGDDLVAELLTNPAHGSLTFYGNGGFTYVPAAGYQGMDAFTYRISDGLMTSTMATARLVVGQPGDANRAPVVDAGAARAVASGVWIDLTAIITDDGLPVSGTLTYQWRVVSGPATPQIANLSATVPSAKMSVAGSYVFRVIASDGARTTAADLSLTVSGEAPPVLPPPTLLTGDRNRDGVVDAADVTLVTNQFGRSGAEITDSRADVDGNGSVTAADLDAVTRAIAP